MTYLQHWDQGGHKLEARQKSLSEMPKFDSFIAVSLA